MKKEKCKQKGFNPSINCVIKTLKKNEEFFYELLIIIKEKSQQEKESIITKGGAKLGKRQTNTWGN